MVKKSPFLVNIPGYSPDKSLNMFQVRDYLMTQDEEMKAYKALKRMGIISDKLDRAVRIEMRRVGFSNF